jgi:hypothetical protein
VFAQRLGLWLRYTHLRALRVSPYGEEDCVQLADDSTRPSRACSRASCARSMATSPRARTGTRISCARFPYPSRGSGPPSSRARSCRSCASSSASATLPDTATTHPTRSPARGGSRRRGAPCARRPRPGARGVRQKPSRSRLNQITTVLRLGEPTTPPKASPCPRTKPRATPRLPGAPRCADLRRPSARS